MPLDTPFPVIKANQDQKTKVTSNTITIPLTVTRYRVQAMFHFWKC
jgi:hypothetical protein